MREAYTKTDTMLFNDCSGGETEMMYYAVNAYQQKICILFYMRDGIVSKYKLNIYTVKTLYI